MYLLHTRSWSLGLNIPGIKRIRFFMTFGQSYLTHLKCLENVGMTSIEPVEYEGKEIVPPVFEGLLLDPASLGPRTVGKDQHRLYLSRAKRTARKKTFISTTFAIIRSAIKKWAPGDQSYTTGVPAMIGAMMMVTGKWMQPGVWNMEQLDPDPFMDAAE